MMEKRMIVFCSMLLSLCLVSCGENSSKNITAAEKTAAAETPAQATVGYFGLDGCDTASHYWGEVYSGIIGMQFDRSQQQKTGSLFLRIDGNNSTGEKIQILLGCDSFGHSLDYILHGGKLAAPQTAEVNLNMKNRYHFENYEEWYTYQNNG